MRIPPPIVQPQNLLQSSGLQSSGLQSPGLRSDGSSGNAGHLGGIAGSRALARAGALDAATGASRTAGATSSFDADTTAKNILDMVGRQLQEAIARGASPQELGNLLQQAREGAQTGFDSAIAQLQDMGELDDSLTRGIGAALQQVDKGFEALAKELGIADSSGKATGSTSLGDLAEGYSRQFATGQSAELTIKTADGDTVRLKLGMDSSEGADGSRRSSGGVTMEVDGELDADETKALNALVDRVGKLADSFFGGDMESALQQADAFEFKDPELSSMSLTLRRSVSAYQDVQSLGSDALADYSALGSGLGNDGAAGSASSASSVKARLAEQLTTLLPEASFAENPASTLKDLLAAQVAARDQQDNPLLDFANRLLDAMGANRAGPAGSESLAA